MKFTICTTYFHALSGKEGEYCITLQRKNDKNNKTLKDKIMKKQIFSLAMLLFTMAPCSQINADNPCSDSTVVENREQDALHSFVSNFSESSAFAFVKVGDQQVLLVSQETFGNNVNSNLEAVSTSIFVLDAKGKIISLGSIRSQGTLYPVSLSDDNKLMVAGHQFVNIYSIRGEVPDLYLDTHAEGEVQEIADMFKVFEKGTPILFSKTRQ